MFLSGVQIHSQQKITFSMSDCVKFLLTIVLQIGMILFVKYFDDH